VPLRFGDDSYFPHLSAARQCGIEPTILRLPGIGLDIDHPVDLLAFMRAKPRQPTRTLRLLESFGL
jgi:2-phospho-L-lactate guanylyltransferase